MRYSIITFTIIAIISLFTADAQPIIQREKNGQVGFYNLFTGNPISANRFKYAYNFSDGIAIVQSDQELWGAIDSTGKVIIKCNYKRFYAFNNDYAIAQLEEGFGVLNKKGDTILPFTFQGIDNVNEGIACVKKNDKWGAIDIATGNQVLPCEFFVPMYFNEGLAAVKINNKYVYVDHSGNPVVPCDKYSLCCPFSNGLAVVKKDNDFYVIKKDGKKAFSKSFKKVNGMFFDGLLAAASKSDGKYGYIDTLGNWVIDPAFDDAGNFNKGLAIADKKIIDHTGKVRINSNTSYYRELYPGIVAYNWDPELYYDLKNNADFLPYWLKKEEINAQENQWDIEGIYKMESNKCNLSFNVRVQKDNTRIGNYYLFTLIDDKITSLELVSKATEKLYAPKTEWKTAETVIPSATNETYGVRLNDKNLFVKFLQIVHGTLSFQLYQEKDTWKNERVLCNYYGRRHL